MEGHLIINIIQYLAIIILFIQLIYTVIQKPSDLQAHIVILLISTILMFVGYIIEINSNCLEAAILGANVSYLGKPFIMSESFMLICTLYGKKINKALYSVFSIICLLFPIILFTNNYHHLYYSVTSFDAEQMFSPLIITRGPLYLSYIFLSISFFSSCIFIIITELISNKGKVVSKQRKMVSLCTFLMIAASMLGYAVFLFNLTNNYDSTMLGVFVGVICLMFLVIKFKILDTVTIAKEYALNDSSVGLIVYNDVDVVTYYNEIAKSMLNNERVMNYINGMTSDQGELIINRKIYSINRKLFYDKDIFIGKCIEIKDITLSKTYQETLEMEVRERTERIDNLQKTIISSIAEMIEARSLETGDHTKRTANYASQIAKTLRNKEKYKDIINEDYIDALTLAVPLHDIGKITIPDSILLKPGKLTEEEFEIMKEHSINGSILIEKTMSELESEKFLQLAEDIAKHHHERWDGNGYPDGLKKEEIPLSARIAAVADCFDALTNERCYKPAYSFNTAIDIIKDENGTHFDPDIVEAFLEIMNE